MSNKRYWKAILKYGHVGFNREISVARYLETDATTTSVDVMHIASNMPAVKNRGLLSVHQIDQTTYEIGKQAEQDSYYLQHLFAHSSSPKAA